MRILLTIFVFVLAADYLFAADALVNNNTEPKIKLTASEKASLTLLLSDLSDALIRGEANEIRVLLSPDLSATEITDILRRAKTELSRINYLSMNFHLEDELPFDRFGDNELRLIAVRAEYEYIELEESNDLLLDKTENSYSFRIVRVNGKWFIAASSLFDQFALLGVELALGLLFVIAFVSLLLIFFWGWMALDAWMRYSSVRYALLILASTPIGAAVYFFAIYLRARFERKKEDA